MGHNYLLAVYRSFVRTASGGVDVKRRKNIMAGTQCNYVSWVCWGEKFSPYVLGIYFSVYSGGECTHTASRRRFLACVAAGGVARAVLFCSCRLVFLSPCTCLWPRVYVRTRIFPCWPIMSKNLTVVDRVHLAQRLQLCECCHPYLNLSGVCHPHGCHISHWPCISSWAWWLDQRPCALVTLPQCSVVGYIRISQSSCSLSSWPSPTVMSSETP